MGLSIYIYISTLNLNLVCIYNIYTLMKGWCSAKFANSLTPRTNLLFQTLCLSCHLWGLSKGKRLLLGISATVPRLIPRVCLLRLQDWPTGEGLLPSIKFRHIAGDAMDKGVLDQADVSNADAIIMGVAHDADPKDVSTLFTQHHSKPHCLSDTTSCSRLSLTSTAPENTHKPLTCWPDITQHATALVHGYIQVSEVELVTFGLTSFGMLQLWFLNTLTNVSHSQMCHTHRCVTLTDVSHSQTSHTHPDVSHSQMCHTQTCHTHTDVSHSQM